MFKSLHPKVFVLHARERRYGTEPVKHFIEEAEKLLGGGAAPARDDGHKCVNFFALPLEGFHPEPARYDVIWIQWCVGHLTDEDFVSFFQRCAKGLKPGGLILVGLYKLNPVDP